MLFTLTVCGSPSETPPEVTVKLLPLSGQTFYFIGETVVALLWFFLTCTQTSLHPESLLSHLKQNRSIERVWINKLGYDAVTRFLSLCGSFHVHQSLIIFLSCEICFVCIIFFLISRGKKRRMNMNGVPVWSLPPPLSQMWARSSDHIETDESMDTHHQSSNTHVLQLHSSVILFPSTKCRLHLNQGVMVINYSSEFSGKLKETGGGADAWEAMPAAHR